MLEPAAAVVETTFADASVVTAVPPLDERWSLPHRFGFRAVFVFVALWLTPFPFGGTLPHTAAIGAAWDQPMHALVGWVGRAASGSGGRTFDSIELGLQLALALVAATAWSLVDRRRSHRPLRGWLRIYLRLAVGAILIGDGFSRMADATAYDVSIGLASVIGGALLYFRRTATAGALLAAIVMVNVAMVDFRYGVPATIFSTELLLAALYIAAPDLPALAAVVWRCRPLVAVPPDPAPFRRHRGVVLAARVAAPLFLGWVLYHHASIRHR